MVDLVGVESNRSAIGARATLSTCGRELTRFVTAGSGRQDFNSLTLELGLGDCTEASVTTAQGVSHHGFRRAGGYPRPKERPGINPGPTSVEALCRDGDSWRLRCSTSLEITWPSGAVQHLAAITPNQHLTIIEHSIVLIFADDFESGDTQQWSATTGYLQSPTSWNAAQ